jgi:hypothetical protein
VGLVLAALIPASRLGVWQASLWPATVAWLIMSGLGLLLRLDEAIRDHDFYRRALLRAIGVLALVEFMVNLESFSLHIEILIHIFAMISTGIVAMEKGDRPYAAARAARVYLFHFAVSASA